MCAIGATTHKLHPSLKTSDSQVCWAACFCQTTSCGSAALDDLRREGLSKPLSELVIKIARFPCVREREMDVVDEGSEEKTWLHDGWRNIDA